MESNGPLDGKDEQVTASQVNAQRAEVKSQQPIRVGERSFALLLRRLLCNSRVLTSRDSDQVIHGGISNEIL